MNPWKLVPTFKPTQSDFNLPTFEIQIELSGRGGWLDFLDGEAKTTFEWRDGRCQIETHCDWPDDEKAAIETYINTHGLPYHVCSEP